MLSLQGPNCDDHRVRLRPRPSEAREHRCGQARQDDPPAEHARPKPKPPRQAEQNAEHHGPSLEPLAQQPAVQQQFTKAAEELAQGNWPGALVAAVGGGGTLVSWLVGKWLYGRVKNSKEGEIIA